MDSSLKLFLIGIVIGVFTVFFEALGDGDDLWTSPDKLLLKFLSISTSLWIFIFMMLVIATLPVLAIESLKRRFTPKQLLPFPLMAGNSFGFLSIQIIAMIFNR